MNYNKITPQLAIELLGYLPQRPDYQTWFYCISAVANHFDEETALNILLTHFHDESPNETGIKIKSKLNSIGIGTLFYYAKLNGYNTNNHIGTQQNIICKPSGTVAKLKNSRSELLTYKPK